jgi:hypothetical protein
MRADMVLHMARNSAAGQRLSPRGDAPYEIDDSRILIAARTHARA